MRIAVGQLAVRQQRARVLQRREHVGVDLEDVLAGEQRYFVVIFSVAIDGVGHSDAICATDRNVVILAVAGRAQCGRSPCPVRW